MRKLSIIVSLTLCLSGFTFVQRPVMSEGETRTTFEIFRSLHTEYPNLFRGILIVDHTTSWADGEDLIKVNKTIIPFLEGDSTLYLELRKGVYSFGGNGDMDFALSVSSSENIGCISDSDANLVYRDQFFQKYPNASGEASISRLFHSGGGKYISCSIDMMCGVECGGRYIVYARKENEKWKVVALENQWMY